MAAGKHKHKVRVLGVDGAWIRLKGQTTGVMVAVDNGTNFSQSYDGRDILSTCTADLSRSFLFTLYCWPRPPSLHLLLSLLLY
jgi:hypothetical protein